MNICIFTRSMPAHRGGKMMFHQNIIGPRLAKRGHQIAVITTSRKDGIENEKKDGMSIFYLKGVPTDTYSKQYWLESARKFEELHQKEKFDIIVSESAGGFGCIKYKIPQKYKVPFVTILHNTPFSVIRTTLRSAPYLGLTRTLFPIANQLIFYAKVLRHLYSLSDRIVCVSEYLKKSLLPLVKEKCKIHVVYNGVDTTIFKPSVNNQTFKTKLGLKDEKIVLYVGRIAKEKGIQFAIRCLPRIVKEVKNIKFIIVGEGNYTQNLKSLVEKMNVGKYVIFTGGVLHSSLVNYYNIADIFILPTIRESFSLVLTEAMTCGKSVVASIAGGIPEIMENGTNGYLVPIGKEADLFKKITHLLKDSRLRNKFGEHGRNKILKRFTLHKMVNETEKIFQESIVRSNPQRT